MSYFFFFFFFFFICSTISCDIAVIGYLPEWRYDSYNYEIGLQTITHLIFFSLEIDGKNGAISSLDRLPSPDILQHCHNLQYYDDSNGNKMACNASLLIGFGGNGRSHGFSEMVANGKKRANFIQSLLALIEEHGFDGVDLNWEYPGFIFGRGYDDKMLEKDMVNYAKFIKELRNSFDQYYMDHVAEWKRKRKLQITLAYYPDVKQEKYLTKLKIYENVDYMTIMAYDQPNRHSTLEFGKKALEEGLAIFPQQAYSKLALGVPFYARNTKTGDWVTYEDIVIKYFNLNDGIQNDPTVDEIDSLYFNGVTTMERKVEYAISKKIGGIMIWEAGQDCRLKPVTRKGKTHQANCKNDSNSLLVAINRTINDYISAQIQSNNKEEL